MKKDFSEQRLTFPLSKSDIKSEILNAVESVLDKNKLLEMRFVGVEFDYDKVKRGEDLVNQALFEGFQPIKDILTPSGIVFIMAKREEKCPS